MKTLKVTVTIEIRQDPDDEDAVREEIKEALQEAIDDDTLDYTVEEGDDD